MDAENSSRKSRYSPLALTAEDANRLLAEYQSGLSATALAKKHQIEVKRILDFLRANGVTIRWQRARFTSQQKEEIQERYLSGESAKSIAKSLGVHSISIYRTLEQMAIKIRSNSEAQRKYFLDESVFDDAENNEEAAYFVGLLMADGHVSKRFYRGEWSVKITLTQSDKDILIRFKRFLKTDKPLHTVDSGGFANAKPACILDINSRRILESLARYGVVPNKSGREAVLLLEDNKHFWRGMVDGDGWVCFKCNRDPVVGLTGSRAIVEQFLGFARRQLEIDAISPEPNGSIWKAVIGYSGGYRLIKHLYANCSVALERKLAKANSILEKCSRFETWSGFKDWSALTAEQMTLLYKEHGCWSAVARHLGMSYGSVGDVLRRLGLKPKRVRRHRQRPLG